MSWRRNRLGSRSAHSSSTGAATTLSCEAALKPSVPKRFVPAMRDRARTALAVLSGATEG
ncbi:hypothetical protein [Nonomuraea sp. NPDC003201]